MPDQIMPVVKITLGGKERNLMFDFNAQAAFEEATGLSVFDRKTMRTSSRVVRALLWSELLHEDPQVSFDEFGRIVDQPELTMRDVGQLITRDNLGEVNAAVFKAFGLFFRKQDVEAAKKKPAPVHDAEAPAAG